jgi:Fe-S oxidoreductase
MEILTLAQLQSRGQSAEYLFWVGCAGSFDDRAKKVTLAVTQILQHAGLSFAVLGTEESCTGDPARRSGNEFLFQMQASQNISTLNAYGVKKIVTACPHCFNTLRNEYPELGGQYEVIHHSTLIQQLINEGRLRLQDGGPYKGRRITFHDSCYLGRANGIYEAPRDLIRALDADLVEMRRSKRNGLCCGAGGAQMFKEAEAGRLEINHERASDMAASGAETVAVACPFCMTMLKDAASQTGQDQVQVMDLAEITARSLAN